MSEELKLTGEIIAILPEVTGTSKAGKAWSKKDFVIEYGDQFKRKLSLTLFGEKITLIDKYSVGDIVEVKFNAESNEFGGKYYTNIGCWFISGEAKSKPGLPKSEMAATDLLNPTPPEGNDLPF